MNRLQKKCFIASALFHLLLALILLIGPAFFTSKTKSEAPPIDYIPSILVEAALAGGGNPKANPPPPTPPAQKIVESTPAPQPEKVRQTDPPKITVKATESLEVSQVRKRTPQVSLTPVKRNQNPKPPDKQVAEVDPRIEARRRAANQLRNAAQSIRDSTSSPTTIEDRGPGGGGPSYAGFESWVRTVYENAWAAPEDAATDHGVTKAKVTIARDGTIISAVVILQSGDPQLDASVQRALDRVTTIGRPFPEGDKGKQRTYIIPFDLTVKRGQA